MSKGTKLVVGVFATYLVLAFMHAWLNIGLDKFNFMGEKDGESSFRVGFLPVT